MINFASTYIVQAKRGLSLWVVIAGWSVWGHAGDTGDAHPGWFRGPTWPCLVAAVQFSFVHGLLGDGDTGSIQVTWQSCLC